MYVYHFGPLAFPIELRLKSDVRQMYTICITRFNKKILFSKLTHGKVRRPKLMKNRVNREIGLANTTQMRGSVAQSGSYHGANHPRLIAQKHNAPAYPRHPASVILLICIMDLEPWGSERVFSDLPELQTGWPRIYLLRHRHRQRQLFQR